MSERLVSEHDREVVYGRSPHINRVDYVYFPIIAVPAGARPRVVCAKKRC